MLWQAVLLWGGLVVVSAVAVHLVGVFILDRVE